MIAPMILGGTKRLSMENEWNQASAVEPVALIGFGGTIRLTAVRFTR